MSLADKRALADQLRGELSQFRVEREAVLQGTSAVAAETQIDDEIARLLAEKKQAQLELEVAKNGGSVDDALAAMEAAAAIEENPFNLATPEDALPADAVDKPTETQKLETPAVETSDALMTPAFVEDTNKDGGK